MDKKKKKKILDIIKYTVSTLIILVLLFGLYSLIYSFNIRTTYTCGVIRFSPFAIFKVKTSAV